MNLDAVTDEITPDRRDIELCVRGDLSSRIEHLERQLRAERIDADTLGGTDEARGLAQQIADLEAQAEEHTRRFTVEAVSWTKWRQLLAAHPPSKDQRAEGNDHDPETFPLAAVEASLVAIDDEPVETDLDQVTRLADRLSGGQWMRLWNAVLEVNIRAGGAGPKSALASSVLRVSRPKSTTAPPEGSPTPSS